jgi:hypothetical protein
MMKLDCTFDDRILQNKLQSLVANNSKNLATATQKALNDTVKDIQNAERQAIDRGGFHLRQTGFIYRLIKVFQFAKATQGIAYAEIGIDPTKAGVLLGLYEFSGSKKVPIRGNLAVPLYGQAGDPRPTISAILPTKMRFAQLDFRKATPGFGTRAGAADFGPRHTGPMYVGKQDTYLIPGVGVFQRTVMGPRTRGGKGAAGAQSHLIYAFAHKGGDPISSVAVPHLLHFADVARETFNEKFQEHFAERFNRSLE